MKVLLHVLSNHLDFAVWFLAELVDDLVPVVSTEVVEEEWDAATDRALQVALAVSGADNESSDVVVVTDFRPPRIVHLERVAADIALRCLVILFTLLGTYSFHWSICPELLHDRRLLLDEHVQNLGERILSQLYHSQLIVFTESRAEDGGRGTHFVLLGVSFLLRLATERLED